MQLQAASLHGSPTAAPVLGRTRVEALDNKEIDCMYYWNYKRPGFTTSAIRGDRLAGAAKR